jgi:hypothetical protein
MALLQRLLGMRRLPWAFLAPNLGVFTFLPIIIDVYYAVTGVAQLLPRDRHLSTQRIRAISSIARIISIRRAAGATSSGSACGIR